MQTSQRLQQARARSERDAFGHDEFMALLSHELRTPLSALVSASEVLGSVAPGSPDDEEARAVIARQTRQLRYVLDELLHIGRALSPKQDA